MKVKIVVLVEQDGQCIGSIVRECPANSVPVAEAVTDCLTVIEASTSGEVDRLFAVHELAEMHDLIYSDDDDEDDEQ